MSLRRILENLLLATVSSPPVLGQDVFLTNRRDVSASPFATPPNDAALDTRIDLELDDRIHEAFQKFKSEFRRDYTADSTEHAIRFATFQKSYMLAHSSGEEQFGAQFGLGKFADATPEEMRKRMGFTRFYLNGNESASGTAMQEPVSENWFSSAVAKLFTPDEVDWVAAGAVTSIKDQGQCGGCWAFSATGALEGAAFVESGILTSLSEQEIIDCDNTNVSPSLVNAGCDGGRFELAFTWARSNSICVEKADPYKSGKTEVAGTCNLDLSTCNGLVKGCVSGYKKVQVSESALMAAVAKQPVSVAIYAEPLQTYTGGIYSTSLPISSVDHAVLVVGYGTTASGTPYWKLKNSWGKEWGEAGYFRLLRGAGSYGTLGILSQAYYPEVVPGCTPGADSIPFWSRVKRWTLNVLRSPATYFVVFGSISMCGLYCFLWGKCCFRKRRGVDAAPFISGNQAGALQYANQQAQPQGQGGRLVNGVIVR